MAAFERANPSYSLLFFTEYTSSCVISSAHNHNRRQSTLPDTNCIRAPSSQNSGYAFGYNTFAELFRWRSMRTAFGAIGKETFDRTSLFADTRLCARLSQRDTPARFILLPIAPTLALLLQNPAREYRDGGTGILFLSLSDRVPEPDADKNERSADNMYIGSRPMRDDPEW